ncbi:hypothetical protein [Vibrio diabolicus]|uniref:hypothetical protein n=1 Tax=Vibrio diabolicus TaxID=50719 RepID=UPI00232E9CB3|nr:hypothetical protein [Vibrio diabolicus]
MKRLYLHVGSWKTGTTTIQETLFYNREVLSDHGVFYPAISAHHVFLTYLFNSNGKNHIASQLEGKDFDFLLNRAKTIWNNIVKTDKDVMLSSEFLLGLSVDDIENLKKELDSLFDSVKVIIYLREPVSHSISAVNEQVKCGHNTLDEAYEHLSNPQEINQAINWVRIFGGDVVIREFSKKSFFKNDLLADFLNCCDIDYLDLEIKQESNSSLSYEALMIADKMNKLSPGLSMPRLKSGILNNIVGRKFTGTKEFRSLVLSNVESSLEELKNLTGFYFHEKYELPLDENKHGYFSDDSINSLAKILNSVINKQG